ncbi:hypothetical protein M409DRAFT_20418 [Zasmidium cellare ATCC 36951]|uniref:Pseudouridine synthase I TruA alpha/beta domain-containing protein n=1 Tax=Zasmidium cellare ATCC 36951 TaxID=1080233 RepID=A0A6A6CQ18_ZASCE|nr:uncharacterized protein M409DRAFT_20418 [Zasmidium cellare ATCC 36951]KAF2169195.1 hypothetical protein M409DRAFT_20418 [Zasmidium cellare ATCC 36951]
MAHQPDYTTWSQNDLIARVTQLETQLRALNTTTTTASKSSKTKPLKKPKPFDPSKYTTRLIALKFAYLGGNYNGFEHHSNNTTPLPTIEEELWKALRKTKLIFPRWREGQRVEEDVSWEGCEYSKCGRTDRGVSAFGQVVGVRVRSARPRDRGVVEGGGGDEEMTDTQDAEDAERPATKAFDPVRDELPYIQLINRVLPPDIRVLAWCPSPPQDFSARFNCKERRYRYFFTNPAYIPLPGSGPQSSAAGRTGEGWLDIEAMNEAAKKYEGLNDFRNLCKIDPSKQITSWERRIFHAGIYEVDPSQEAQNTAVGTASPKLYYFEVRGSAFLWHQVRHLVAVLFLVGQGYEKPSIVDELLDVHRTPARPVYEMASDIPLVLWDCIFPDPEKLANGDHADGSGSSDQGYVDALDWVYVGDEMGGRDQSKRSTTGIEDGKHGRNGIMDELWSLWRKRKMDEVLAWSLMDVVSRQGPSIQLDHLATCNGQESSDRVFDGSEKPRTVGDYVPVMQRERMEPPDVVNARYAARKGLTGAARSPNDTDMGD